MLGNDSGSGAVQTVGDRSCGSDSERVGWRARGVSTRQVLQLLSHRFFQPGENCKSTTKQLFFTFILSWNSHI